MAVTAYTIPFRRPARTLLQLRIRSWKPTEASRCSWTNPRGEHDSGAPGCDSVDEAAMMLTTNRWVSSARASRQITHPAAARSLVLSSPHRAGHQIRYTSQPSMPGHVRASNARCAYVAFDVSGVRGIISYAELGLKPWSRKRDLVGWILKLVSCIPESQRLLGEMRDAHISFQEWRTLGSRPQLKLVQVT
ncbi:hypothetical protein CDV31_006764 [Fusarium ambrosium]|uniref:Uncharacterized protein n=1 Tax=Fusarium ambrosium TaxID=131363 RepID=A0A428UB74_9HYPO|nr:hypothetical protein CDV31_006764 [Fusarium ambrosium]